MPRTPQTKDTKEFVRLFPGWASVKAEKWLSKKASKGWLFTDTGFLSVYRFKKIDAKMLRFAVEYMGKNPDIPLEIANDCNSGWEYAGRFGKFRYYYTELTENETKHPALDNKTEAAYLRGVMTNLITLMLLNIPGTLYCAAFIFLFFIDGGFVIGDLLTSSGNGSLYLFGCVAGITAYITLFKWLRMTTHRLNFITGRKKSE